MIIVELDAKKLVGFRVLCQGDQYAAEIPKAAVRLENRLSEITNLINPEGFIGAFVVEELSAAEDGYWVCVEVSKFEAIPDGMVYLEIPAQKYAVISHRGPNTSIRNTYDILHRWEAEYGFERLLSHWHLEISRGWYAADSNEIQIDLHDTIR